MSGGVVGSLKSSKRRLNEFDDTIAVNERGHNKSGMKDEVKRRSLQAAKVD
jgi:hypothetical protein